MYIITEKKGKLSFSLNSHLSYNNITLCKNKNFIYFRWYYMFIKLYAGLS